jgi:hypothetical protein
MRSFALTVPDRQYGVDVDGREFASPTRGRSRRWEREYNDGQSPLLARIAEHFYRESEGVGGRFYECDGWIVVAHAMEARYRIRLE